MHLIVSVAFVTGCSSEDSGSCGETTDEEAVGSRQRLNQLCRLAQKNVQRLE